MDAGSRADLYRIAAREQAVLSLGPLAAPGRLRRLAPFAAPIVVALPLMQRDSDGSSAQGAIAAAAAVLTLAAAALLPWSRWPRAAQPSFALVSVLLASALVVVGDGLQSPLRPLVLLPLFWLMLYESRKALLLGLCMTVGFATVEALTSSSVQAGRRLLPQVVLVAVFPIVWRIVSIHREAITALAELSERDALTGVVNRGGLDRRVRELPSHPVEGFGVIYLDVDRFKAINDELGHASGDELLRQVAMRLHASTRRGDVVARIGGDEFVVVLAGDRTTVSAIRDRVQGLLDGAPYSLPGGSVTASVTVGFSYALTGGTPLQTLISNADEDMLARKSVGRVPVQRLHPASSGQPA